MRPTLPSAFGKKSQVLAVLAAVLVAGCHHDPAPVAPGEPIPAPAEVLVDTMDHECNRLVEALLALGECPNHEEDQRAWARQVAEIAQQSFEAGKKGKPDEPSQHVIALACHRAADSVQFAIQRCKAGPLPKGDY
jgi:hypothetical protein